MDTTNRDRAARYARQLVLPGWGPRAQAAIEDARVLVIGAGGLGSPTLLYLVAAGVGARSGAVGVLDADTVEVSNLHRQVLHGTADEGRAKTDSALDALRRLDPAANVTAHPVRLTPDNAADVIGGYDLVVDGCDNFPTRYLVADTCARLGIPLVWGAVQAFGGQVGVALPGHACYRCVFPDPPAPGAVPSCAQIGVLGSVCASVAASCATEALKVLGGVGTPLVDRVQVLDALAATWDVVPVRARPDCPCTTGADAAPAPATCSLPAGGGAGSGADEPEVPLLTAAQVAQVVARGSAPVVDVRTDGERAVVAVPGSLHVPLDDVLAGGDLPFGPDDDAVLYCRSGVRSHTAALALAQRGYRVRELDGGVLAWVRDLDAVPEPAAAAPAAPGAAASAVPVASVAQGGGAA